MTRGLLAAVLLVAGCAAMNPPARAGVVAPPVEKTWVTTRDQAFAKIVLRAKTWAARTTEPAETIASGAVGAESDLIHMASVQWADEELRPNLSGPHMAIALERGRQEAEAGMSAQLYKAALARVLDVRSAAP